MQAVEKEEYYEIPEGGGADGTKRKKKKVLISNEVFAEKLLKKQWTEVCRDVAK